MEPQVEPDKNRTAKPLARPWGSTCTSISAEKRQARESTPDADDERAKCIWWSQHDPQTNTIPDGARNAAQTYQINKMDSPLIRTWADQSTNRPPHNSVGARRTAEADTNTTRSVPTAEPEDALWVRPQRTPNRQKLLSAQSQQTAHCTPLARSTTPRPQHPTRRRPSHVPPAWDSQCCTAHPPALTAPDAPKAARTQSHTRHLAHWWDEAPISISRPDNDRN